MQYLGGKSRIAKQIIDIMSAERLEGMPWVEPFMGSGKVISKVKGRRIGADINHEMIALFKAIRGGWQPPTEVTKDFWHEVRNNQDKYPDHLKAFIGIGCSFGAMKWRSYAQNARGVSYAQSAYNGLMKMKTALKGIELYACGYDALNIPDQSLIYCDPPYRGTAGYGFDFDHDQFYQWCRDRAREGHFVFISEYNMPSDFEEVWVNEVNVTLNPRNNSLKKTERLYRLHEKPPFSLKMY